MLLVEAEVENGPQAARATRERIAVLRSELDGNVLADIMLLVSELVTNAYRHSGAPSDDRIVLRVSMKNRVVRVEVEDRGEAASEPHLREPDSSGGWGLHIVSQLADRWGTKKRRKGNLVWFELEVPESGEVE
jgi:anti-sigma regulatory factor (Ser/Thr protein kinase)